MKNKKLVGLSVGLILAVVCSSMSLALGVKPLSTKEIDVTTKCKYKCELIWGGYLDLDDDGFEDDLRITAELTHIGAVVEEEIYMFMYLVVYFPSGDYIDFAWAVTVYVHKDYELEFQILDGALESGWYTSYLVVQMEGTQFTDSSGIIFDPPMGAGNTDPTISVFVS